MSRNFREILFYFSNLRSFIAAAAFGLAACSTTAVSPTEVPEITAPATAASAEAEAPGAVFSHPDQKTTLPSWELLAKEFAVANAEEMKLLGEDFVKLLTYGRRSDYYAKICGKKPELCVSVDQFMATMDAQARARAQARRDRRQFGRALRVTPNQVKAMQAQDIRRLLGGLTVRTESEFEALAKRALEAEACPRNFSAVLSLRAARFLPSEKSRDLAKALFDHAEPCLSADQQAWEMIFLRHGLAALVVEDYERAERLLVQSMSGPTKLEQYRALYWLGWLQHRKNIPEAENRYWQVLNQDYPLSYYSIRSLSAWGKDPMELIPEQPLIQERESKLRPDLNQRFRWLEVLVKLGSRSHAKRWMEWLNTDTKDLEKPVVHYLSAIALDGGYYRQNITLLIRYYRLHPDRVDRWGLKALYPRPFFENVHEEARDRIHTHLVMSLIRQESAFDPQAVSSARAKGLMQIIPRTARLLLPGGDRKLFDEKHNTHMGIKYLARLGERFSGEVELALAAYNAGPNRVDDWLQRFPDRRDPLLWNDLIPFLETRDYVVSILRNNYWYERLYPMEKPPQGVLISKLIEDLVRNP